MHKLIKSFVSPMALVPCTLLLVVTTAMMVIAIMQADDFEREMTNGEVMMALTPLLPLTWLVAVIVSGIVGLRNLNKISVMHLAIALVILLGYLLWLL